MNDIWYSNRVEGATLNPATQNIGNWNPNCHSFIMVNQTTTIVTIFNGIQLGIGQSLSFDEMRHGIYNTPFPITFADPDCTGTVNVIKIIKVPIQ